VHQQPTSIFNGMPFNTGVCNLYGKSKETSSIYAERNKTAFFLSQDLYVRTLIVSPYYLMLVLL
jgi:hypothetical protein